MDADMLDNVGPKAHSFFLLAFPIPLRWPPNTNSVYVLLSGYLIFLCNAFLPTVLLYMQAKEKWEVRLSVNLIDLLCYRIYPRPSPSFPSPKSQKTFLTRSLCEFPLILYFACSLLPAPALSLFWDFHSLAQTALALTRGHPMLSLSNYLTNRSETALISAYCSAWLIAASLGGLSGKLWYGGPTGQAGRQGRTTALCSWILETPRDTYSPWESLPQEPFG